VRQAGDFTNTKLPRDDADLARLLYDAMRNGDPECFTTTFDPSDEVTIDGSFDLVSAARWFRRACTKAA
jgi:hypothetical protein